LVYFQAHFPTPISPEVKRVLTFLSPFLVLHFFLLFYFQVGRTSITLSNPSVSIIEALSFIALTILSFSV